MLKSLLKMLTIGAAVLSLSSCYGDWFLYEETPVVYTPVTTRIIVGTYPTSTVVVRKPAPTPRGRQMNRYAPPPRMNVPNHRYGGRR